MSRIPSFAVAGLFLLLAAAGFADRPHGLNAVNVRLAIAAPGDGLGLDGLSAEELDALLTEASSRAGYGAAIPEGLAESVRVYDIAAEILQERTSTSGTKLDRAKVELIRSISNLSGGGNPDLSNAYATFASDLFEAAMLLSEEGAGPEAARYSLKIHMIVGNRTDATDGRTANYEVWNQPLRGIGVTVEGSVAEVVLRVVPANPAASAIWGYGPEGSYRVRSIPLGGGASGTTDRTSIPLRGGPSGTTDRTSGPSVWNFHVWNESFGAEKQQAEPGPKASAIAWLIIVFTPAPAPSGSGDVQVEYFGQMSNPFPFTKN